MTDPEDMYYDELVAAYESQEDLEGEHPAEAIDNDIDLYCETGDAAMYIISCLLDFKNGDMTVSELDAKLDRYKEQYGMGKL